MINNYTNLSTDVNVPPHSLVDIASRSEQIILPCLLLIGTTCNMLTFIVMRRGRMRHSSSCFYMAALAIADTFVLWIGCLNRWLELLDKQRPILACNLCCKLGTFGFFFFADCSVWITVSMTFERYIAVSQPLRASQICTIKRARYMLLIVLITFFLINAHFLWTFQLIPTVSHCIPSNDQSVFIKYFTWIDSFKYSFCPFTLLITLNILIIRSLLNARNTNKFLQQSNSPEHEKDLTHRTTYSVSFSSSSTTNNSANTLIRKKKSHSISSPTSSKVLSYRRVNRRLTTMLLTVSFAFCICSMPISIMQLIDAIYSDIDQRSPTMNIIIHIGKIIAEISQYINHSSNFFLYAFTGRVFRHELRRLFHCHRFSLFTSSDPLTKRSKEFMLLQNRAQGVHEHFYANGKRHTRILIAPKRSATGAFTSNYSENGTYRQSMCSVLSASEIPLTFKHRQDSLLSNDENDEQYLTCYHRNVNGPRVSSITQATTVMLFDSPKKIQSENQTFASLVGTLNKKKNDVDPLVSPFHSNKIKHSTEAFGFPDITSTT